MDASASVAVFESVLVVQLDEGCFWFLSCVPNSPLSPITLANQPKVTYRFPVVVDIPKNDVAGPVMRFCFPETETADGSSKKQKKKKKKELKKAVKRYPQNSLRFY